MNSREPVRCLSKYGIPWLVELEKTQSAMINRKWLNYAKSRPVPTNIIPSRDNTYPSPTVIVLPAIWREGGEKDSTDEVLLVQARDWVNCDRMMDVSWTNTDAIMMRCIPTHYYSPRVYHHDEQQLIGNYQRRILKSVAGLRENTTSDRVE